MRRTCRRIEPRPHLIILSYGEQWADIRLALSTCNASLFLYRYPNHKIINIHKNDHKYAFGYARDPVPRGLPKYIGADNFLLNFFDLFPDKRTKLLVSPARYRWIGWWIF